MSLSPYGTSSVHPRSSDIGGRPRSSDPGSRPPRAVGGPPRTVASPQGDAQIVLDEVLAGALGQALDRLPGVTAASLMARGRVGPTTLVHHGQVALATDTLQRRLGTGPTLEALRQGREFVARARTGEPRWEELLTGPAITFALALPMLRQRRHGARAALTLYGSSPDGLGPLRQRARPLAEHLGGILRLGEVAEEARRTVADMNRAVDTRAVVDQAIGILMARQHCSAQDAFALLRRASQSRNLKLRDVCQEVVDGVAAPRPE
ncbi:GAF and ANTAR domain-containing protein [Kitasatospora sp. NPDC002040]|uniref:GAF and ANTAR domain-containing protein n=1 Tax=Kitasatospora sp. NPDC002040 TaxID=3154661 RepID=UPI0033209C72